MSKPLTYYIQTTAIDDLTASFGSQLQYLPREHKIFMFKCIFHQYADGTPMSDVIDQLDPDALIPERVCGAIVTLDGLHPSEAENLMEAIVAQLRSERK